MWKHQDFSNIAIISWQTKFGDRVVSYVLLESVYGPRRTADWLYVSDETDMELENNNTNYSDSDMSS